jgi:putative SOS response-associated peptidase YedK
MCGRFTLRQDAKALQRMFQLLLPELEPRYNIAPTQDVLIVRDRAEDAGREAAMVRWGLVPWWATDTKIGNRMINARAESAIEKRSFKQALLKRRCLVVADGWYEWQRGPSQKQPYLLHFPESRPFAFAGMWERWEKGGEPVESCTILTTAAADSLADIHDRMPLVLDPSMYDTWLDPTLQEPERILPMLAPAPMDDIERLPVSTWVNNPRHEGPMCVAPVEAELF